MKIAFIFSGQGSQYIGMGKELYENIDEYRESFEIANKELGFDIKELIFNDKNEELNITKNTQPAILTTSIATLNVLRKKGIKPDVVAGLSLGEYSALVAAGAIEFKDAVSLVRKRGHYMQEAVPVGVGAMIAVLGMETKALENVIKEASKKGVVEIANYNTDSQIVIGGEKEAVDYVEELCIENGARKVIKLNVSGPFHTSLLEEASLKLGLELEKIDIKEPKVPIITNVTGKLIEDEDNIKELLTKQVKSSVKWSDSINSMLESGIDTFIEIGPGKTLSSFVKEIARAKKVKVSIFNVEDMKSLNKTLEGVVSNLC